MSFRMSVATIFRLRLEHRQNEITGCNKWILKYYCRCIFKNVAVLWLVQYKDTVLAQHGLQRSQCTSRKTMLCKTCRVWQRALGNPRKVSLNNGIKSNEIHQYHNQQWQTESTRGWSVLVGSLWPFSFLSNLRQILETYVGCLEFVVHSPLFSGNFSSVSSPIYCFHLQEQLSQI